MTTDVRSIAHEQLGMQQARWTDAQYAEAIRHHLGIGKTEPIPLHELKNRCVVVNYHDGRSVFSMDNVPLLEMYRPSFDINANSLTITTKFKKLYD